VVNESISSQKFAPDGTFLVREILDEGGYIVFEYKNRLKPLKIELKRAISHLAKLISNTRAHHKNVYQDLRLTHTLL
jgi:hypothetical protein